MLYYSFESIIVFTIRRIYNLNVFLSNMVEDDAAEDEDEDDGIFLNFSHQLLSLGIIY